MEDKEAKILEDYVTKMLEVQEERYEKPLSLEELKEIAFSIGMTDSDWELSQQAMRQHLKTGLNHLKNSNWEDANSELVQAVAINPFLEEGLYNLALVNLRLYEKTAREDYKINARAYADRALKNEDTRLDNAAIALLNDIRGAEETHQKKKRNLLLSIGAALGIVAVLVLLVLFTSYSIIQGKATSLDKQKVEVDKNWGQVENIYKRRESIIPQIVSLSKAASNYDQAKLDKLLTLQKNLNSANRQDYIKQQDELSKMIAESLSNIEANATSMRDLQVQIEGSENRLRVEWKKYNEAVADYNQAVVKYNSSISAFPSNIFGFKAKEKMVSEQVK